MPGFVDEAQLHAKAGNGGAGAVSFRREAHVAMGGPDGGDGGDGGDVWLVATTNQASLLAFRDHPHRRATDGRHGQGKRRHGARGMDMEVAVPVGTTVRELDGSVVADLAVAGDRWLAAAGGRGGHGNARFASNRRRAPDFAEQGEVGEERWLDLELRLVADVALVGFPNAGKSTLISRISAAKPKIADYPFTTLEPNLGVVRVGRPGDETELVVADVPGLVEGAAEGRGLGHRFLRHVERARVLVVLLDMAPADSRAPGDQLRVLLDELSRYRPELLERPRLVVGSKLDLAGAAATAGARATASTTSTAGAPGTFITGGLGGAGEAASTNAGIPGDLAISAVTGQGLGELVGRLAAMVTEARSSSRVEVREPVVHRPLPEGLEVTKVAEHHFVVGGRQAARAVALSDVTGDQAADVVQRRLRRLGVERALRRAGVRDGDLVEVGALSFEYHRDDVVVTDMTGGRHRRRDRSGAGASPPQPRSGASTTSHAAGASPPQSPASASEAPPPAGAPAPHDAPGGSPKEPNSVQSLGAQAPRSDR